MRHIHIIIMASALLAASSCRRTPEIPVTNLYQAIATAADTDSVTADSIIAADSTELKAMFQFLGIKELSTGLLKWYNSYPAMKIFKPDVDSVYPTLKPLEAAIGHIVDGAARQQLGLPERRYAAVVWGNLKSIVLTDSVALIALNHYLGSDYPGYNNSLWPAYMRTEKTPANLPYDIAESLVATSYPFTADSNTTALSRMLYEGALIEAKMRLVDHATAPAALGYSDAQWEWIQANNNLLWQLVVDGRYLYDKSQRTAEMLVDRAPATSLLAPYVPPRIGRYIGYRIVRSYLDNHDGTTLVQLLSPSFYNNPSALVDSGFDGL